MLHINSTVRNYIFNASFLVSECTTHKLYFFKFCLKGLSYLPFQYLPQVAIMFTLLIPAKNSYNVYFVNTGQEWLNSCKNVR